VLASALSRVLDVYEEAKTAATPAQDATWFDVLTAAAFLIYQEADIDVAVVEVGIGGRLDSTNVVKATVAVVTNVELEHTEILGHTREAIAREKGGILKPGAALVTSLPADDSAGVVLHELAQQMDCPVYCSPETADTTISERNVSLAGLALTCLGKQGMMCTSRSEAPGVSVGSWLLDAALVAGTKLPGRMERLDAVPSKGWQSARGTIPIILDGAHVPFNVAAVFRDLRRHPDLAGPCCVVLALGSDKNADGMMEVVKDHASVVVCTELPRPSLSHSAEALSEKALVRGLQAVAHVDPQEALRVAMGLAFDRGRWVLVTGSLYLVGVARSVVQDW
jgi:dihydrofolate synthase/folylpolyglutamate synthase